MILMFVDHKPYAGTILCSICILFHFILTAALRESSNIISIFYTKKMRNSKVTRWPMVTMAALDVNSDRLVPEPHALVSDATEFLSNLKTGS